MAITGLIESDVDLDLGGVKMTPMNQLFATSDEGAHTIRVNVCASERPVDLSSAGVFGYFIRSDDDTVVMRGTATGNTVELILAESCYAVVGHFTVIIKVTLGEERKAVFWGDGHVTRSSSDVLVDPGAEIPSLEELLAQLDEMEKATRTVNEATKRAQKAADNADRATKSADDATKEARELTDRFDDVRLEYEVLPPSADPWAALEQDAYSTRFKFGLPQGNLAYSTFSVDRDMHLIMTSPAGRSDIGFQLNKNGHLEVKIN